MTIADRLLAELDLEAPATRKTIERVPDAKLAWQPHPKSMRMGHLAQHLGNIPWWGLVIVSRDSYALDPADRRAPLGTTKEITAFYDENLSKLRDALKGKSDEHMRAEWSFSAGGREIVKGPREDMLRRMVLYHSAHHRAQLGVFLRLNDIPVPGAYGPSADES